MTVDRPTTLPPQWAESLLRMMLPPRDRDSVSGDLLEEYRESIVPSRGAGANRWYVTQVARHLVRQTWLWGTLAASVLVTRFIVDILAPIDYTPHVIALRSVVTTWLVIATVALGPAWQAWRTGHVRSGLVIVLATAWIGGVLTCAGTFAALAIWHDPAAMQAIARSGGIDEATWGMPILLTPVSFMFGVPGALVGRTAAAIYGWSSPNTKSA